MANTHTSLKSLFVGVADAIRSKKNTDELIVADNFPTEIMNLKSGFDYTNDKITTIVDGQFKNCEDIKSVDCYNLQTIGDSAFENCTNLKNVILYETITDIGENAFKGCNNLDEISVAWTENERDGEPWGAHSATIHYAVIGNRGLGYVPDDKDNPTSYEVIDNTCEDSNIRIPRYYNNLPVTGVAYYGFDQHENLNSIILGDNIVKIGRGAFRYCINLASIKLPAGLITILSEAFYNCRKLTDLTIPNSVTNISNSAFGNCDGITSITIPNSIVDMGMNIFSGCDNLTTVIFSNGVTHIAPGMFSLCSKLTNITIPNSVISIENNAFNESTSFKNIYIKDIGAWCNINFVSETSNPLLYGGNLYLNGELLTEVVVPDVITNIRNNAFNGCTSLTNVNISDSVTSIGASAFNNCINLTNITIPDSVISIGGSAFRKCTNLTSITIPDSVISIGAHAFRECSNLTSVNIPPMITEINNYTFYNCTNLMNITLPNGIIVIGDDAFEQCLSLTSIDIPDGVVNIGYGAFRGCTNLTNITIPDSVTCIEGGAFSETAYKANLSNWENDALYINKHLIEVKTSVGENYQIKDGTLNIAYYAFDKCSNMTKVIIPSSIASIGHKVFYYCTKLTNITYMGTIEQWCDLISGVEWEDETPNYTIYCTDGTITKDGTITYYTDGGDQ